MQLSEKGQQLILKYEVGGGKPYYDKLLQHPIVPDPQHTHSGVTIGIGWDCGQTMLATFAVEWGEYLTADQQDAFKKVIGLKGMDAYNALSGVKNITISWEIALDQFLNYTIPRFWKLTSGAFPGIDNAPLCVQEAVLSLVFNRGTAMSGDSRIEMRAIRDLIEKGQWKDIPAQFRAMKRLWPEVKGLRDRRDAEAAHIEAGL